MTSVVWLPEVIVPLAAMTALPAETCSPPVTEAAASGFLLFIGTIAMGPPETLLARGLCAHTAARAVRASSQEKSGQRDTENSGS